MQRSGACLCDQLGHLTVRVVQVAEDAGLGRARLHAGRLLALGKPVGAEVALPHCPHRVLLITDLLERRRALTRVIALRFAVVESARVVWARDHAIAAANTRGLVHRDDPVGLFLRGARWAYIYTGCVGAVV